MFRCPITTSDACGTRSNAQPFGPGASRRASRDRVSSPLTVVCVFGSAFGIDDHQNQALADWFGIVMGTSHEEPMMRSTPVEWDLFGSGIWDYDSNAQNIYDYWMNGTERSKTYENVFTVGMRGAGACALFRCRKVYSLHSCR